MAYNQNNSQRNNDEVYFDLMEHIGVLANKDNGWAKEVNIVAWNGGKPKVDIRDWDPKHERMTKGITLFEEEAEKLVKALARRYGLRYTGTGPSKTFRRVEHTTEHTEEIPFKDGSDAKTVPEEPSSAGTQPELACAADDHSENASEDLTSAAAAAMAAVPPMPEAASAAAPA